MTDTAILDRTTDAASARRAPARGKDDAAMLKAAANLTRDLNVPSSAIYWADMLGSALLGYAALFGAMFAAARRGWRVVSGLVAVLALYRAGSFIHELTHIKKGAVKGFRFVWNLIVGVPLLIPSFMYEGVHNQHHAKRYYGTADDPEYLPLALMHPWTLPLFLVAAALAPVGMLIRFAILAPLSLIFPRSCARSSSAAIRGCRSTRSSCDRSLKASSRATGRGRRRRAASGRSRCSRWSRPASSRCAIS